MIWNSFIFKFEIKGLTFTTPGRTILFINQLREISDQLKGGIFGVSMGVKLKKMHNSQVTESTPIVDTKNTFLWLHTFMKNFLPYVSFFICSLYKFDWSNWQFKLLVHKVYLGLFRIILMSVPEFFSNTLLIMNNGIKFRSEYNSVDITMIK